MPVSAKGAQKNCIEMDTFFATHGWARNPFWVSEKPTGI